MNPIFQVYVQQIFRFSDYFTLLECRTVCKNWCNHLEIDYIKSNYIRSIINIVCNTYDLNNSEYCSQCYSYQPVLDNTYILSPNMSRIRYRVLCKPCFRKVYPDISLNTLYYCLIYDPYNALIYDLYTFVANSL
jgi:hypothetical protein